MPSRLPTEAQSFHFTPSSHAIGAKMRPRISLQRPGQPSQEARIVQRQPECRSPCAISPINAISIAPTFSASCNPSEAPREAASIMFTPGLSTSIFTLPAVARLTRFPECSILASISVAGAVMITAVNKCRISTCAIKTYAAITAPETCAIPLDITVNSSLSVMSGQERTNGQRRFGLPHEDAGGDVHGFRAAGAHHPLHHHGHGAHQHLHDAQVVQDAEQRRDEDDDGQHLKREDGAEHVAGRAQLVAEDELAAFGGVIQQMVHSAR